MGVSVLRTRYWGALFRLESVTFWLGDVALVFPGLLAFPFVYSFALSGDPYIFFVL